MFPVLPHHLLPHHLLPHPLLRQRNKMVDEEYGYLWNRHHQIKVRVLSNRIYQQERQRRFEWREGIVKAMSIIAGSLAFANVANQILAKWCFLIITVFNIFSLVFSYGAKARESSKRATDWALLERDIDGVGERGFNCGGVSYMGYGIRRNKLA